jgi:hypothetical protein
MDQDAYMQACRDRSEEFRDMDAQEHFDQATEELARATALQDVTSDSAPLVAETLASAQVHGLLGLGKLLTPDRPEGTPRIRAV